MLSHPSTFLLMDDFNPKNFISKKIKTNGLMHGFLGWKEK